MSALASVLPRGRDWRRWAAVVTGAALAVLAVAQSSLAASFTIQARNYDFVAPAGGSGITITVGDEVTWVASGDPHTVTSGSPAAIDHRFPDRPAGAGFLFSGQTFTTTFATAGTYPYFCEVHPEQMSGVVQVLPVSTQTPTPTKTSTPSPSPMKTQAPTAGPTSGGSAAPTVATPTAAAPSVATPTAAAPSAVAPTAAFPSPTVLVPSALVTTTPDASVDSGVVPTPTASPISSADGSGTADPGQTQATSPSGTLIAAVAGLAITALVGLGLLSVRRRRRSG